MSINIIVININLILPLLRSMMGRKPVLVLATIFMIGVADCCHRALINKCENGEQCSIVSTNTIGGSDTRIIQKKGEMYHIQLQDDPCDFYTYNEDGDGIITLQELIALFHFRDASEAFFEELNINSDDEGITSEEFYAKAPVTIRECVPKTN